MPLVPLLRQHGLELIEHPFGNFELRAYEGLLVKESYWRTLTRATRWPERQLSGNPSDFFIRILDLSFHEAMRKITAS